MINKIIFGLLIISLSTLVHADKTKPKEPDVAFQSLDTVKQELEYKEPSLVDAQRIETKAKKQQVIALTEAELLDKPELLEQALLSALQNRDSKGLKYFIPLYEKLQLKNETVLKNAYAIMYRLENKPGKAIQYYREILAEHPQYIIIQMYLASALYENTQYRESEQEFKRILNHPKNPPEINQIITQYLEKIDKKSDISFGVSINYLSESNVNRAPKKTEFGHWRVPEKEPAHGFAYSLSADKDFFLKHGWLIKSRVGVYGKWYWDNHKYDDLIASVAQGIAYQNAQMSLSMMPNFDMRWYRHKWFSKEPGYSIEYAQWLTPQSRVLADYAYGRSKYIHEKDQWRNSKTHRFSLGGQYFTHSNQYFGLSLAYHKEINDGYLEDSFDKPSMSLSWGKGWANGLSSNLNLRISREKHKGVDIFNIRRVDKNYMLTTSLWHKAIQYKGITPRLVISWENQNSNHPAYKIHQVKAYINLSKYF